MSDQRGVERPLDGRRDEADGMVVHEERLTPGVERYEVGRVEVRKRIIVEELTVTLPVRREVADLVRVYDDGSEEVLDLPPSYWEPRIEDRTGGMPYGEKNTPNEGPYDAVERDGHDERRESEEARSGRRDEVYDGLRDEQERAGADDAAATNGYDIVLHEERPVISTEVYAVERLRLDVERETQTMTYTDSVRREVVDFDLDGDTYPDITR
ncbi:MULTISPECIES: DUF2382 domain-containing protein [Dermacoccus]|uniref:DUF2382 domain-containing protein n=3 Tax=Dermacoccus TaxID=57495 RepID=A0A417Z1C1_9MICO|nr:DUF2382 domain-containing protein [Dermacoccus abyssi]RHW44330.1 DUF2382 domain-containing protein [Dermacoccus abyssi]